MSSARKLSRKAAKAGKAPAVTPAPPPTMTEVCEQAARVVDGIAAEHGMQAIVIVYDPTKRGYHADWRGAAPDLVGVILLRALHRIVALCG